MDEKELAAREAALVEKEAQLAKKEKHIEQKEQEIIYKGSKERLYDKIKVPVKVLDVIIVLCFIAIAVCLILGSR